MSQTDRDEHSPSRRLELQDSVQQQAMKPVFDDKSIDPKPNKQKGEPLEGLDLSWANGNDRRTKNIWNNVNYFTPRIL